MAPEEYERLATLVVQESAEVKALLRAMDGRQETMDGRLDKMDGRLGKMDGRLDNMDGRLDNMDGRLGNLDGRVGDMDGRLGKMDGRLDKMDGHFDKIESRLSRVEVTGEETRHLVQLVAEGVSTVDRKVEALRGDMTRGFADICEETALGFHAHDVRLRKLERGAPDRIGG